MFDSSVDAPLQGQPDAPPRRAIANTQAALLAPRLALASCVRTYLVRNTMGVELSLEQRHNHFPASPLCSMMWLVQGASTCVFRNNLPANDPVPTLSFLGPHTERAISVNPAGVHAFMVILLPQAVQAMTGLDLASLVNKVVPMESVLDADWLAMAHAVQQAPDDSTRVRLLEAFLMPRWSAVRQHAVPRADRQRYWVEALALQAATSGMGKSLRQIERRIKDWAGLPLRDLRRLARSEESFIETRETYLSDPDNYTPNWADIAADQGYSDQSHLCRETRRVTGLSPNELKRAVAEEESYWIYRIWG